MWILFLYWNTLSLSVRLSAIVTPACCVHRCTEHDVINFTTSKWINTVVSNDDLFDPGLSCAHRCTEYDVTIFTTSKWINAVISNDDLFHTELNSLMDLQGWIPYHPRRARTVSASWIAFLLISVEPNPGPNINFGSLNARSIRHKDAIIKDLISDHHLDILAISETWIYDHDHDAIKNSSAPEDYSMIHACRQTGLGGELAFIFKKSLCVKHYQLKNFPKPASFEFQLVLVGSQRGNKLAIVNLYRPPIASRSVFVDEFSEFLSHCDAMLGHRLLICGDFNFAGDCGVAKELVDLLDEHGSSQFVSVPTRDNNILDILAACETDAMVTSEVIVTNLGLPFDHNLVSCKLLVELESQPPVKQTFRDCKSIDVSKFRRMLSESPLFTAPELSAADYADQIETITTEIINELAPIKTCSKVKRRRPHVWLSDEAISAKRRRRRLERKWKRGGLEKDRLEYRKECKNANSLTTKSLQDHNRAKIEEAGNDSKKKWQSVKKLLQPPTDVPHQCAITPSFFAEFFIKKVDKIRDLINSAWSLFADHALADDPAYDGESWSSIEPVSAGEVTRLIASSLAKTSPLDYLPTSLLKAGTDLFGSIIATLANKSFLDGSFPQTFKSAQVKPLLKKSRLDPDNPSNYRPISNLNTISKILERLFLSRLRTHVSATGNFNSRQSGFRPHHSTETALQSILNDIYRSIDARELITLLVALDISAAFDALEHDILLKRLEQTFGIKGCALNWIRLYLSGHTQCHTLCQS